jgi:hypothetical protein
LYDLYLWLSFRSLKTANFNPKHCLPIIIGNKYDELKS